MSEDKWRVEAVEMDVLRRSAGIARIERIPNTSIKEIMKIEKTITESIVSNDNWFGTDI